MTTNTKTNDGELAENSGFTNGIVAIRSDDNLATIRGKGKEGYAIASNYFKNIIYDSAYYPSNETWWLIIAQPTRQHMRETLSSKEVA